jgi:hypothetical protein
MQERSGRRPWKLALAVALLVIVALVALRAVQTASAARSALAELQGLQAVDLAALTSLDPANLADMQGRFARLEADLDTVAAQVGPVLPLTRSLGWLPRFGAEAQAVPELLQLARGAATAGRASMDGAYVVAHALQNQPGQGSALARLTAALEQSQPSWQEAEAALAQVTDARSQLDLTQLDPRIASQLERLDSYLPLCRRARPWPAWLRRCWARTAPRPICCSRRTATSCAPPAASSPARASCPSTAAN